MAVSGNDRPNARFHPYVPQPWAEAGEPPSSVARPASGPGDEWELPGDQQPEGDLWDFDPDIKLPNEAYRGVRRASVAGRYRRVGLVVGVVVAAAAVALFIVMKPVADPSHRADGDVPTFGLPAVGADQPTSKQPSGTASATGVPGATSPAGAPAFAPLTFEAEAGPPTVKRRGGDIETLAGASGGKVVRFVGGSGDLEIRGVAFTGAGTYRIAIYYASGAAGTAAVSMPNTAPLTVSFAGGSGCCAAGAVDVALPAGQRTITISEVTDGVAIDRVVITRIRP